MDVLPCLEQKCGPNPKPAPTPPPNPEPILLMDLGLPDMTGHAAVGRILAHRPQQRVVVVSMFGDEVSVRQAMDAGALGYVLKDAPPEQVLAADRYKAARIVRDS